MKRIFAAATAVTITFLGSASEEVGNLFFNDESLTVYYTGDGFAPYLD